MNKNIINVDGQIYESEEDVWDLGSFVAVEVDGTQRRYQGLSKDVDKLPHYVGSGSTAFCLDTGEEYHYLASKDTWYKLPSNESGVGGSIGGIGVNNYNDLSNRPQINGNILKGNLTTEDLGIKEFSENYNDLKNIPKINNIELKGELSLEDLGINENEGTTDYTDLDNKPQINGVTLEGELSLKDLGLDEEKGTTNYENLENKPKINDIELIGDLSLEDLGFTEFSGDYNDLSNTPDIPTKLPNPNSLTFGGIFPEETYDGSKDVNIILPDFDLLDEFSGSPIGEIIPYMGNTAPANYLICDGTEYNIDEYKELSNHFLKEFGKVNYFGGDGETTFAVPDLRGEFLRGSGAATRATGSGAAVGRHQEGTEHIALGYDATYKTIYHGANGSASSGYDVEQNVDKLIKSSNTTGRSVNLSSTYSGNGLRMYTSRPTNTAVLYCIKYKPTYYVKMSTNDTENDNETNDTETIVTQPEMINFSNSIKESTGGVIVTKKGYIVNGIVYIFVAIGSLKTSVIDLFTIPTKYAPSFKVLGTFAPIQISEENTPTYVYITDDGIAKAHINVTKPITTQSNFQFMYPLIS